ncbi:MAG: hypothetical protein MI975_07625 [Cytophagales bacterium]|nr:hypothetical protein [Cytophagales bacterium]
MKIQGILFFTILTISVSSCTEDDIENPAENELVGLWRISDVYFEGTTTTNVSGKEKISLFTGSGYNLTLSIEFSKLENQFTSKGSYNIRLTTNLDGADIITEWMNPGFIECGKWKKDGNSIIVTKPDGKLKTATILSLEQSTMKLSYDFSYEIMRSEETVTYDVNGIFTFDKH